VAIKVKLCVSSMPVFTTIILVRQLFKMKKEIFIEIVCSLLILLFVYSGTSKLIEHAKFVFQLKESPYPFIKLFAGAIAWIIPAAEIIIACLLTVNRTRIYGLWLYLFMLASFELYISGLFLSGKNIPCTCGGLISHMSWHGHLAFNASFMLLIAASLYLMIKIRKEISIHFSRA
jgi:hypothetical protein